MASLLDLLGDFARAGVYQTSLDSYEIIAAAKTLGLQTFQLNIGAAQGKVGLLERFAKTLRLPAHFGANWDALNDCLTDLSWLDGKGWVLLLGDCKDFADSHPEEFATAVEILQGAAAYWRSRDKAFWVFVRSQGDWPMELAKIFGA